MLISDEYYSYFPLDINVCTRSELTSLIHVFWYLIHLIELLYNENLLHLYTRILTPYIENFIKDINGNHIIQKFVFFIGSPRNQFLFNLINNKIVEIATHKHGCCVLQKCIEGASATQRVEFKINLG